MAKADRALWNTFFRYMCEIGHNVKCISYCESLPQMFEKHSTIWSLFQI